MRFTRIKLTNWKNFREVDVALPERAFLIGPNASGKSNFLDAFRFLRDLAKPGGGLRSACDERGGVSKIRCLSARRPAGMGIEIEVVDDSDVRWSYRINFAQETQFPNQGSPIIQEELVLKNDQTLLSRPDSHDDEDPRLLSQTALEQISANREFRPIVDYFAEVSYLHLVPQMIRDTGGSFRDQNIPDMYGGRFLERVAKTPEKTRKARLHRIQEALKIAVPQLKELELKPDERGVPHLEAVYKHWRPNAGRQNENQFSDGTLRLIGLLWALQDGSGVLLMEEPELSLHKGIVTQLAPFIHKAQRRNKRGHRQTFISTHSVDLLSDPGIGAEELVVFIPNEDGTTVKRGLDIQYIKKLMESGLTAAEAAVPYTTAENMEQLRLFDL